MLAALIQMADGERCRIRLAAPTGKAAARLTESLGKALRQLPLTDEQKKRIPEDASTLHRLLGAQRVASVYAIMPVTRCILMCWW